MMMEEEDDDLVVMNEAGCALKQIFPSSALPHVPPQAPEANTTCRTKNCDYKLKDVGRSVLWQLDLAHLTIAISTRVP